MAKKSKGKDIVVAKEPVPATIIEPESESYELALPKGLTPDMIETEAKTTLNPVVDFSEGSVGTYFIGRYVGRRDGIGPNKSSLYDFEVPDGAKGFRTVSVWGSTIFNVRMAQLEQDYSRQTGKPIHGKYLYVEHCGNVSTSRGLNPAKDFRIIVLKDSVISKL